MIPRRLDFYFGLYDMDGSGSIDEDEIYRLLERGHSSVKNLHQDATKSLLEEVRQEKKRKEKKRGLLFCFAMPCLLVKFDHLQRRALDALAEDSTNGCVSLSS
jgi:hypothetical protein